MWNFTKWLLSRFGDVKSLARVTKPIKLRERLKVCSCCNSLKLNCGRQKWVPKHGMGLLAFTGTVATGTTAAQ